MTKTSEYLNWIIEHSNSLSLKLIVLKKPDWYTGNIFSYAAIITLDDVMWDGYGTHKDESIAIIKAVSEAIERSYMLSEEVTSSNGFAIHIDKNIAYESAMMELLERDAFLTHFYSKTPFYKSSSKIDKIINNKDLKQFQQHGIRFRTYNLHSAEDFIVCAVVAFVRCNDINGYNISLGVSRENQDSAIESATYQLLNSLFYFCKEYKCQDDILKAIKQTEKEKSIHYHSLLPFIQDYRDQTQFLFSDNCDAMVSIRLPDDLNIKRVSPRSEILSNSPLHCYLATSKKLQNLFFATENIKSFINLERLKQLNPSITMDTVLDLPHPFD